MSPAPTWWKARTGHSMAQGLARLGAQVILASLKSKRTPEDVLKKINSLGITVEESFDHDQDSFNSLINDMHLVYLPGCSAPKGPEAEKFKDYMDNYFVRYETLEKVANEGRNIYVTHTLPRRAGEMDLRIDNSPASSTLRPLPTVCPSGWRWLQQSWVCSTIFSGREEDFCMDNKVAVIAIGGNSLVNKGRESIEDQYAAVTETCKHIADMIEQGWTVAIGHGNGPQVGFVLRRSEVAHRVEGIHEVPLDVCGADTKGATGYMLQQNLYNEFLKRGIDKNVTTVVTQVEVDRNDPAFQNPTKPIGTFMEKDQALEKKEKEGWSVVEDAGRGWRRVVPSPLPKRVVEEPAIKALST